MAFDKHLLVDVANVVHAQADLRVLWKRDRDAARGALIRRLGALHDVEGVRVTAVVDGRGPEITVEYPLEAKTLAVVYTSSALTADDVIEQMVGRSAAPERCEVVTGDQAERNTVEATGAIWVSPDDLWARLDRAEQRLAGRVTGLNAAAESAWKAKRR